MPSPPLRRFLYFLPPALFPVPAASFSCNVSALSSFVVTSRRAIRCEETGDANQRNTMTSRNLAEVKFQPFIRISPSRAKPMPSVSPIAAACIRFRTYLKSEDADHLNQKDSKSAQQKNSACKEAYPFKYRHPLFPPSAFSPDKHPCTPWSARSLQEN